MKGTAVTAQDALLGRWEIVSWEQDYDDGRREYPMGENLEGFIQYLPEGDVICMISRRDRHDFVTGGQWDADVEEMAGAYRSMLAYAGRYDVVDEVVTHHIELSLFPNWRNGGQRRTVAFRSDGVVAIEARLEEGTPEARTARLTWRRRSHAH